VPDFVRQVHPNVHVVLSSEYPGLRDNGKFLPLSLMDRDCYYFTADDDIVYPPDYINAMLKKLAWYGEQVVVGVHGVLIPEQARTYFSGYRKVLLFKQGLEQDALVNNLGTGTVAFRSRLLKELDYRRFMHSGMVDLYLAVFCKSKGIPMVAIERPDDWLVEPEPESLSLYQEFVSKDEKQSELIRANGPWGYASIRAAVNAVSIRSEDAEVIERLRILVPDLHACLL
jgi:hypothetical protein